MMKRFVAFLLLLTMLFSLVSCADDSGEKKTKEKGEASLSEMSAEEFYSFGIEKNKSLISARYETKVSSPNQEYQIDSVRIRSGYDGFTYSRQGNGYLCFDGEKAYVENENGKFTSSATLREFEEYLSEFVFPVYGLGKENIRNLTRDGDKVFYESENGKLLSLYAALSQEGDFIPEGLKGEATLNKEGIILSEKIILSGKEDEGDVTYTLETTLTQYRSDSIQITLPEEAEGFVALQDIRIPQEILFAKKALLSLEEFHLVLVSAENVSLGEKTFALNEDKHVYQVKKDGALSSYFSRQSLKQRPDAEEESLFYQVLTDGGVQTENLYNVILGEKLSEQITENTAFNFVPEIEKVFLASTDLKNITKEEGTESISYRFELNEEACQRILGYLSENLSESGISSEVCSVQECAGTLSIEKETGALSAITYTVGGTISKDGEGGRFSARYSFHGNPGEEVLLPDLQIPTPTTPGM